MRKAAMTKPLPNNLSIVNVLAKKLYETFLIYVQNEPTEPNAEWERAIRGAFASQYPPEEFEKIVARERATQKEIIKTRQMRCGTGWIGLAWEDLELFEQIVFISMASTSLSFVKDNMVGVLDHIEKGNALGVKLMEKLGADHSKYRNS